ncbi:MAG: hypothetical protein K2O61_08570 [Bacteroidaceae bacterium]|nr:hypothetical protein [Bacteroidaceae bacterium]
MDFLIPTEASTEEGRSHIGASLFLYPSFRPPLAHLPRIPLHETTKFLPTQSHRLRQIPLKNDLKIGVGDIGQSESGTSTNRCPRLRF